MLSSKVVASSAIKLRAEPEDKYTRLFNLSFVGCGEAGKCETNRSKTQWES